MTDAVRSFMDKKAVAQVLEQIAAFLELKGENPFRIRAFRTAARAVGGFPGDLRDGLDDGTLASTKGVGPATLQIVAEIVTTGRASMLEELREQIPPGLVEMLAIPGLGVAKIRQIHEVLGIDSLPELEAAALDGRLARLPRFGPKTSENILKGIAYPPAGERLPAARITPRTRPKGCAPRSSGCPACSRPSWPATCAAAREVVRDLVLVLVADVPPGELFKRLSQLPGVHEFAGQDDRRLTLRFAGGASAQIVVTTPVNTGAVLVQATGSEAHLRAAGRARGGARPGAHAARRSGAGARSCRRPTRPRSTRALGLDCIPPELREGEGEIEAAAAPHPAARCSSAATCAASSTATPATPTAPTRSRSWRWPAATRATSTSASPITARRRPTPAGSGRTTSPARRTRSTRSTPGWTGIRVLKGVEADILQDGRIDFDEPCSRGSTS